MVQYGIVEINIYDNTKKTCVICKAFKGAYIYCPMFNFIIRNVGVKFDETGELNCCELYTNRE